MGIEKKNAVAGICAGLALSAIDAMASTQTPWEAKTIESAQLKSEQAQRLEAMASLIVSGPRASQSMGHAWFRLSERLEINGKGLLSLYEEQGLGEFIKTQANPTQTGAGQCYSACYGNCYGNCYSNCFSADS